MNSDHGKVKKCGKCGKKGHNRRTCGATSNRLRESVTKHKEASLKTAPQQPPFTSSSGEVKGNRTTAVFNGETKLGEVLKECSTVKVGKVSVEGGGQEKKDSEAFQAEMEKLEKTYEKVVASKMDSGETYTEEELDVWWQLQKEEPVAAYNYRGYSPPQSDEQLLGESLVKFVENMKNVKTESLVKFLKLFGGKTLTAMAEKSPLSPHTIKALISASDGDVRIDQRQMKNLLRKKETPLEAILSKRNSSSEEERVLAVSQTRVKNRSVDFFAEDPHAAVRVYVGKKSKNPTILKHYALHDSNQHVVSEVLGNPQTPPEVLTETYNKKLTLNKEGKEDMGNKENWVGQLKHDRSSAEDIYVFKLLENPSTPIFVKEQIVKSLEAEPDTEPLKLLFCPPNNNTT